MPPPLVAIQYTVDLTLEEVYHGCLKRVTHKRKVITLALRFISSGQPLVAG
jgi:hypothetical protein